MRSPCRTEIPPGSIQVPVIAVENPVDVTKTLYCFSTLDISNKSGKSYLSIKKRRTIENAFKSKKLEFLTWVLDQKALKYERAIAGKFLLVTTADLEPEIVMKEYKNLQEVERCFNDLKNLLKLRPVYHRTDRRTKGHVFVCVLSLLLEKLMEKHTKKPFREIKEKLEPLRVNRIEVYGEEIYKRNSISSGGDEVLCRRTGTPPLFGVLKQDNRRTDTESSNF